MMKFNSIEETTEKLDKVLDKVVETRYINKAAKSTREITGILLEIELTDFLKYVNNKTPLRRQANYEIDTAFYAARNILLYDKTARYAIGEPYKSTIPSCLVCIQLLLRDDIQTLVYFRSMDIKEFPYDLGEIGYRLCKARFNLKIKLFVGSLHKYIEK